MSIHTSLRAPCGSARGFRSTRAGQRGAVLIVALIFLVLITILALSASGSSLMQQKMVAATRNAQLADWGAESTLRGAEWRLWTASSKPSLRLNCGQAPALADCFTYNPQDLNQIVVDFRSKPGWYVTGGTKYTGLSYDDVEDEDASPKLAENPYYIIEDMGPERPPGTGPMHESGSTGSGGVGYESTERHLYRITARSTGGSKNAVRVVESIFAAKSN